jgi:hypothetical protein
MRTRGWERRATAVAAIALVFSAAAPKFAVPVGASPVRSANPAVRTRLT